MKKRSVSANTIWIIGQQVYSMILSLVVGAISARYLGPSNYGVITYGASLITIASTLAKLGLDGVVIKRLTTSPEDENKTLGSALFLRSVSSLLLFATLNFFVYFAHIDEPTVRVVILLQSIAMVFNAYEIYAFSFQAKLEYSFTCIAVMVAATVANAWKIIIIIKNAPVEMFATPTILQSIVAFIIVIITYKKRYRIKLKVDMKEAKSLFASSYHLLLSAIAVTVYTQIDRVMIKAFLDDASVGIYSSATVLAMLWEFIPQAIINAYRPVVYKNTSNKEEFDGAVLKIMTIIVGLSLFIIIAYFTLGRVLILIVYGEQYISALPAMHIIAISTGFAMLSTLRGVWMIAKGYEKYDKYCVIFGASTNFALNLIIIPKYGIVGAAYTTLIAQIVNGIVATYCFKSTRAFLTYISRLPRYSIKIISDGFDRIRRK